MWIQKSCFNALGMHVVLNNIYQQQESKALCHSISDHLYEYFSPDQEHFIKIRLIYSELKQVSQFELNQRGVSKVMSISPKLRWNQISFTSSGHNKIFFCFPYSGYEQNTASYTRVKHNKLQGSQRAHLLSCICKNNL